MTCARVQGEYQSTVLSTIAEEGVANHLEIQKELKNLNEVAYHQKEHLYLVANEMNGIRQDMRMVIEQISSNGPFIHQRQRSHLERRSTTIQSRTCSSNLPDQFRRMVRNTRIMSLRRHYWFGLLQVNGSSDIIWRASSKEGSDLYANTSPLHLQFVFIPPCWVSDRVITIAMDSNMAFTVDRTQINPNPSLLKYLEACDINALKSLFSQGKAKPTDLVLDERRISLCPESLLEASFSIIEAFI